MFNEILIFILTYIYIPLKYILGQSNHRQSKVNISELASTNANQVIVLTGGTGGLGYNILKRLLQIKVHVIVGVRNSDSMREIITELEEDEIEGSVDIYHLDLESLNSVRTFCDKVLSSGLPINGLINAAAIMAIPFKLTQDRNETQFQVNYLSHFLLTNLLLSRIIESSTEDKPGIIINVSSVTCNYGKLDFDNIKSNKGYNKWQAHYNSKLYQALFSHYFGIKLKQRKANLRVNSIHPGFMETPIWHNYPCSFGIIRKIWGALLGDPANGADDIIYIAFHPETSSLEHTGEFFIDGKINPKIPKATWVQMEQLWDLSCELVNIPNIFPNGQNLEDNPSEGVGKFREKTHSFINILPITNSNNTQSISSSTFDPISTVVTPLDINESITISNIGNTILATTGTSLPLTLS